MSGTTAEKDGSSPRSRGTPIPARHRPISSRFIPALAGNTTNSRACRNSRSVHPRARGEHPAETLHQIVAHGSSPRSRGTPADAVPQSEHMRFIPALAGNTPAGRCGPPGPSVHPRARGEHRMARSKRVAKVGSSPRSRGTRIAGRRAIRMVRFIPALAGNTSVRLVTASLLPVHPRARGEHRGGLLGLPYVGGSSPRSRGTRIIGSPRNSPGRFIPALAGNTPCARAPR